MLSLPDLRRYKENWFASLVVLLTGFWIFLIPFGKGEQVPATLLAALGLFQLIGTKGRCTGTPAAKSFLLLLSLYLIPIAISLTDAISFKAPFTVLLTGVGSGLAGLAIISATVKQQTLLRITLILAAVVGFWFLDAGVQAVFGRDVFGLIREGDRLSGPFLSKRQMGCYSGPFSALLLIFALQKNCKPVLLWTLFIFTSIIVLLNNSRGGWVMYGVVAAVFSWQAFIAPRKHKLLVCVGLIALGLALVTGLYSASETFKKRADQTLLALQGSRQAINDATSERVAVFESAWKIFRDYPVNGVGARNYRKLSAAYWPKDIQCIQTSVLYPHQLILEYASETGLIGLTGLAASVFLCIRWWLRAGKEARYTSAGYALTLLALYFPLNTHKSVFSSELATSLWILIALYTAAIRTEDPS